MAPPLRPRSGPQSTQYVVSEPNLGWLVANPWPSNHPAVFEWLWWPRATPRGRQRERPPATVLLAAMAEVGGVGWLRAVGDKNQVLLFSFYFLVPSWFGIILLVGKKHTLFAMTILKLSPPHPDWSQDFSVIKVTFHILLFIFIFISAINFSINWIIKYMK